MGLKTYMSQLSSDFLDETGKITYLEKRAPCTANLSPTRGLRLGRPFSEKVTPTGGSIFS